MKRAARHREQEQQQNQGEPRKGVKTNGVRNTENLSKKSIDSVPAAAIQKLK